MSQSFHQKEVQPKEKTPLDIESFDMLLNPDTLENMQILDFMDDALSIELIDLLKILEYFNFSVCKDELVKMIDKSKIYMFDEQQSRVKLRNKSQRRTIVFPSYDLSEDIKEFFKSKLSCEDKIQHLEKLSSGIVLVYFFSEDDTVEVFKKLEKYKFDNNLQLYASIRSENLKRKITERVEKKNKDHLNESKSHIIADTQHYYPRKLPGEFVKRTFQNLMVDTEADDAFKKRSYSFFDVSPTASVETPKTRKSTMNKYDGDIKSAIKNYYNKYNLVFDPDKYVRSNSVRINKSVVLDLDSLPDKKKESNIDFKYSFAEIMNVFTDVSGGLIKDSRKGQYKYIPAIMNFNPKTVLDSFKEKKERRDRAATFYEQPKKGYELYNSTTPKSYNHSGKENTPTNNMGANNAYRYTLYNPNRKRIGSYNLIN